ncbi:MAG TPA: UvrD-helicase domain-containing protein, partial [Actinomycetales bacterium]|nr:UvrD-helicase domain-containing protein [Actinomycetales bacterium]
PRRDPAELLEGLNPQQAEAVLHAGGPLLIIAGAGSGKTRVLTHRIAHLLATGRARPGEILAITFTNKAAAEMRERVAHLVGPAARHMWVSTFHSACVRILRAEHEKLGIKSSFSIYDAADSQRLMTLVARSLDLDPKRFPPKMLTHRVSDLKNELVDPDDFAARVSEHNPVEVAVRDAYRLYQRRLKEAHALDFDDLIMTTVNLLQAFPAVAEHYHRRFRHVLVDEYQDTNHAQYVLVRELVGDGSDGVEPAELTVVGDSDQSIYAFRGATIRNIEEFEKDYTRATTILLEQNYRSTGNILSAANAVISKNGGRREKNLWTAAGAGAQVTGYVSDSEHDEARFIAEEIDRLGDAHGIQPKDVAVFYRTNAQSRALEEVFIRAGLPYKVVGGTRFYERREIKDAIAYLRAIDNPDDAVNLRRILNVPKRGIGDRSEAMVAQHAEREGKSFGAALADSLTEEGIFGLAGRAQRLIGEFHQLMEGLREFAATASPAEVLDAALDRSGYLAELRASEDPQDATRVENLAELHAVAAEFAELEPEGTLGDFLERVSLVADSDQIPDAGENGGQITLMTVHTAKGLEFPVVFVTGLEDGTFPHSRSLTDESELAEERRLAYVALTRARQRLYLSRAAVRTAWGSPQQLPASRFLSDIPEEVLDWRRAASAMESVWDGSRTGGYGSGGYGSGGYGSGGWSRGGTGFRGGSGGSSGSVTTTRASFRGGTSRPARGSGSSGEQTPSFGSATPRADVPSLSIGDRVTHDSYGLGTVVGLEGSGSSAVAKIDFGTGGTKRLMLRYTPVEKL